MMTLSNSNVATSRSGRVERQQKDRGRAFFLGPLVVLAGGILFLALEKTTISNIHNGVPAREPSDWIPNQSSKRTMTTLSPSTEPGWAGRRTIDRRNHSRELAVIPNSMTTEDDLSLEGRVIDESGNAIAQAEVLALCADQCLAVNSQPDGRFVFPSLPESDYLIYARSRVFASKVGVTVSVGSRTPMTKDLVLVLEPARCLRGRVVDSNRHPIPEARLCVIVPQETSSLRFETMSCADGTFQMITSDVKSLELIIEAAGFERRFMEAESRGRDDLGLIALDPLRRVCGYVYERGSGRALTEPESVSDDALETPFQSSKKA